MFNLWNYCRPKVQSKANALAWCWMEWGIVWLRGLRGWQTTTTLLLVRHCDHGLIVPEPAAHVHIPKGSRDLIVVNQLLGYRLDLPHLKTEPYKSQLRSWFRCNLGLFWTLRREQLSGRSNGLQSVAFKTLAAACLEAKRQDSSFDALILCLLSINSL